MTDESRRHIAVEPVGDVAAVRFVQPRLITEEEIQGVGDELIQLVERAGYRKVVVNFDTLQLLTSPALVKLINLKKRLAAVGGQIRLCSMQPEQLEIFRITHLDSVFPIDPDLPTALDAIGRS